MADLDGRLELDECRLVGVSLVGSVLERLRATDVLFEDCDLSGVVVDAIRSHHLPPATLVPHDEAQLIAVLLAVGRRAVSGVTDEWLGWEPLAATGLGLDLPMIEAMADRDGRVPAGAG